MAQEMKAPEMVEVKNMEEEYEKAKQELLLEDNKQTSGQLNITTTIWNMSKGRIKLIEMHFWNGHTRTGYHSLPVGYGAYTLQGGTLPQGVKFGYVYTDGEDANDTTARKFVVAVDSPTGKIYAEAGPMGPVDWNVVEVKLGMATDKVTYEDHILGGKVVGEMVGVNATAVFRN